MKRSVPYYREVLRKRQLRRVALLVLLLNSLCGVCAAPEGILHAAVGTTVDGTMALEGMRVFAGQTLRTSPGRLSELLTRGGSLRLLGDTQLEFKGDSAELIHGGVLLNTGRGFEVQSDCAKVSAEPNASVRYLVQRIDQLVYVTVQQNDATVTSRKSVHVPMGKTVAVYCSQAAQPIVFVGSKVPAKVMMGAAAAATPLGTLPSSGSQSGSKQPLSSSSP